MIRNIIFDMGQVLIRWEPTLFLDRMGVPQEDRARFSRETFYSVEWVQLDRGIITPEQGAAQMRARLPERLHPYVDTLTFDWWKDPLVPMPGMAELIAELKGMGLGIYLLSNATRAVHAYFPRIPGSEHFDGLVVSADYGQLKPEREIFATLFDTFHLKPDECFYVDDLNINIEGGRFAGMAGFVFRGDTGELREALRAAGVPVK